MSETSPVQFDRPIQLGFHDGRLCIVGRIDDWNDPIAHFHYWPIQGELSARSILRNIAESFGTDDGPGEKADPLRWDVRQSRPGEYWIANPNSWGIAGLYVALENGARTESIHLVDVPIPRPKRCREAEYRDGHWFKLMAAGWKRA